MKKVTKYYPFIFILWVVSSCNTIDKKKKINEGSEVVVQKEQSYAIDTSGVALKWTSYKFTDRLAVGGTFDRFTLHLKNDSGTIETLLRKAEISINTGTVNSGNEIRDPKLRTYFFEVFNTDTIYGKILVADQGKGTLLLEMNNITNEVDYSYSLQNDTLHLATHLDLLLWNGAEAIGSLNKECYDLHKGLDGISKLWPDVDVTVKFPVIDLVTPEQ
tara:strand:- start:226 stop:876 length:651 start_codon:yes stop_codon:yes gene_type:complete